MVKKSTAKRGMAFNALAIVFIMAVLPFMIMFLSSASAIASSGEKTQSIQSVGMGLIEPSQPFFEWQNNGVNVTGEYITNHPPSGVTPSIHPYNCLFIEKGLCSRLTSPTTFPTSPSQSGYAPLTYAAGNVANINVFKAPQTHADPLAVSYAPANFSYRGSSGAGVFSFTTYGRYYDLDPSKAIDELQVSLIDTHTSYSSSSSIFENITYDTKLIFKHSGKTLTIENNDISGDNKMCYSTVHESWQAVPVCWVAMKLNFDLTSFQSHYLQELTGGDYDNLSITFEMTNFEKKSGAYIGNTALPFAGIDDFAFGVSAKTVDTQALNFIVKGGSLVIGLLCVFVAIASTPLYDPLKNALRGLNNV